jgi:ferredoxin
VLVHVLVLVHVAHWKVSGSTFTPLEPSEAMQTLELGYLNAGFVVFVALILLTMVLGRFFCGWACHVVAYQDGANWLLRKAGIHPKPVRSRLLVWVPFGAAFYMFFWPQVSRLIEGRPFPTLEAHFATTSFWQTFPGPVVSILTDLVCGGVLVYFLGSKGFCTYGCPYGAFFGVADQLAVGRIRVTDACEQCGICTATCTSNVRVHEEVAKFRMVVDSGCMKTMDCISACPKRALYYGKARPTIFSRRQIRRKKRKVYDFTWVEEIALALFFLASLYAWRGLYEEVPFLLALGLSVLSAFSALTFWRFARYGEFTLQAHVLRRAGRPTRAAAILAPLLLGYVFLTGHSGFVQYQSREGERLLIAAESAPDPTGRDALVDQSLVRLRSAERWGLIPVGGLHLKIGSILRARGDLAGAETEMGQAISADPSMRVPYMELAGLLIQRGALEEAEPVLERLLDRYPDHAQAQDWLTRLRVDLKEKRAS